MPEPRSGFASPPDVAGGREFDYIVIGGGHNGLVAANYLARSRATVLLLEQRPYLGGMAATQAHISDAPGYLLSKGAIDAVFIRSTPIPEELGLYARGLDLISVDPGYGWINEDGDTLAVFKDVETTSRDIARYSRKDARAYLDLQVAAAPLLELQDRLLSKPVDDIGLRELAAAALRLIGHRDARRLLSRLLACSAYEAIATTFESDPLRSLLAYWTEIACPADVDGSGLYLAGLSVIHRLGCSRPRGGMGRLIDALERTLKDQGGAVRLDAGVERVLVSASRAVGVRLTDGSEILAARGVLAGCAPQLLYGRLLDAEHLSAGTRQSVSFMPANVSNMCPFKVDMAIAGRLRYAAAQSRRNTWDGVDIGATSFMTGSFDDHLEHAAALRRGRIGRRPPLWMTVLSHADRSLAPEGHSVAYLYTSAPMELGAPGSETRESVTNMLVASAGQHLSGLDQEIGRCVTTPEDFERQYGAPRGCLYHVDMLPTRLALNRPAAGMGAGCTDIANLHLAGAGGHPGGGVFGAPGRLAAKAALEHGRRVVGQPSHELNSGPHETR